MILASHTFPVLEGMQNSWLGSFPMDEGLPPSHGCQTHGSCSPSTMRFGIKDLVFIKCSLKQVLKNGTKASNSLFFLSLLPVRGREDCVPSRNKGPQGWALQLVFLKDLWEHCSSFFLGISWKIAAWEGLLFASRFTEYSEQEGTHKDHRVKLFMA